jgi:hypothetical protein|nr:MAG TPA: hypothetical protein [Bacteriophage sp.]
MVHSKEQIEEIMMSLYEQLGGHKFVVATGSKFTGYAEDENGNLEQYISLARNASSANKLKITYDEGLDLYNMIFERQTFSKKTFQVSRKEIASYNGVYFDQLAPIFESVTGMYTRLF